MKTSDEKTSEEKKNLKNLKIKKNFRQLCSRFENRMDAFSRINANLDNKAAAISRELNKVFVERQILLKKLAEYDIEVDPAELYLTEQCEARFYRYYCKDRVSKMKTKENQQ